MEYTKFQNLYGKYFSNLRGGLYCITVPHSLVHVVDPKNCAKGKGYHECCLKKGDPICKIGEGGLKSCESSLMARIASYKTVLPNGFTILWICVRPRSTLNKEEACLKGELSDKGLIEHLKNAKLHYCNEWMHTPSAVKRASMQYHEEHFPNCSFYVFSATGCTRVFPKPRVDLDELIKNQDKQSKSEVKKEWKPTHEMGLRKKQT